jgi:rhodanese-related sulfurtransferase
MDAPAIPVTSLRQSLASARPPLVIDVRRNERFLEAKDMIRGALRRDPAQVEQWKGSLPADRDIVVYCVFGHEVSQGVAAVIGARYLEGGIEGWRAAGGELEPRA